MKPWALLALGFLAASLRASNMPETFEFQSEDGVRIHGFSLGQGEPLLFVPGWLMTGAIWKPQMEAMAGQYRMIVMDPRGQGDSEKPKHGYDSRRRAYDIRTVIQGLNLERPVLIGWSLGAIDAVNYLNRCGGQNLRALVLIDNSVDKHYSSGVSDRGLLEELKNKPYPKFVDGFVRSLFQDPLGEAQIQALIRESLKTPPEVAREAIAKATSGAGLAAGLQASKIPTFYMVTPHLKSEAQGLERALGSQLSVDFFENSGHAIFVDEAERFRSDLLEFLAKHP
jgi:microsomal epoxide hydrolase